MIPDSAEVAATEVDALLDRRRLQAARARLAYALRDHPDHPQLLVQGAWLYFLSGDANEASRLAQQVLAGEVYVPSDLRALPENASANRAIPNTPQLTPRQMQVLHLLLDGRSNKEISQTLHLADETTKTHVTGVLRAFGVQTRIQAVLAASRLGYLKSNLST